MRLHPSQLAFDYTSGTLVPTLTGTNTWALKSVGSSAGNLLDKASGDSLYASISGATFTGKVITPASTTGSAGLNIPAGSAPTSPTNGDIWATTSDVFVRINGTTKTLARVDGNITGSAASLTTGRTISTTGDVTYTSPSFDGTGNVTGTASIATGAVTLAKMANLAANSIIGNNTGAGAAPIALTATQTTAMLNEATVSLKGLMSSGDKTKLDGVATGATANDTDANLKNRANHTGTQAWSTITSTPTTLSGYGITDAIASSQKGAANGVATLGADSKIPTSQLPALAITQTSVAANQTAHLAVTAQEGDVVVRTDENKSYIHNGGSAGTMADWQELLTPTDTVTSVNGQTGVVSLDKSDIGLANVDNTSDAAKPVSTAQQTALNAKAALAGATFTGAVITAASATGGAGLRLPHGAAPSSPTNGDVWTTTTNLLVRINAATKTVAFTDSNITGSAASLTTGRTISTTGDVTYTSGSFDGTGNVTGTANIAAGVVTLAKMANLSANSFIGNNTGAGATPSALTGAQATALLSTFGTTTKGLVPSPGTTTGKLLSDDGTWVTPSTGANAGFYNRYVGDNTTTAFTLAQSVSAPEDIIVTINGLRQDPTNDYTVSGTTLTISPARKSGDIIIAERGAWV